MKSFFKLIISKWHQWKISKGANKKINKIYSNISVVAPKKEVRSNYQKLWKDFGYSPSIKFLSAMQTISGIASESYVPEDIHYSAIEPVLNNRVFALAYNDKNFFELFLLKYKSLFPETIIRGINGLIYNKNYKQLSFSALEDILRSELSNGKYILKPAIETGGGDNVVLVELINNGLYINNEEIEYSDFINDILVSRFKRNFVFQNYIQSHKWFSSFNSSSLNTIRIYTYRSVVDDKVHILSAYIRFGGDGSIVDSSTQGGKTCGVMLNGKLNSFAIGKFGERYNDISWINKNAGLQVPYFNEMKKLAEEIAHSFAHHRLLGFDFCLDKDSNIRLLEVNNLYIGIINQQMNTGPLFGKHTKEILDYCSNNERVISFHFKI